MDNAARWFASAVLFSIAVVLMTDEPWSEPERPDLPGDEWKRDPEQGSQPDHVPPPARDTPEERWQRRLYAGPVNNRCPRCSGTRLRFDNKLGLWCYDCDRGFSRPMSYVEAMTYFTGSA